jgi:cytoskeleton protein RodZ
MSESGSETRSGIGARLRAGRERMGLTLLQAAEKLHVDPKVIECLETERFEALGATVFVKGHLKRYAELIGEQAQLIEIYNAATKPALPDLTRVPKAAPETKPGRLAVPSLVVLIGFVLIGVVWWVIKSMPDASDPEAAAAANDERNESEVQVVPETLPPVAYPEQVTSTTPMQGTAGVGSTGASTGTPGARTSAPGAAAVGVAADAAAPAASTTTPPPAGTSRRMEVKLRFAADSWVEIYDSKGERLFADVGTADSEHTVSGTPPLRVTFGNAPGVSLDVNGKPATVPANLVSNDSAQFTINRSGRIVRARPQADGG